MKRLPLPQHEVTVTGIGRDVPVYLERPIIDFQCCLMGHTYRDVLLASGGGAQGGREWQGRAVQEPNRENSEDVEAEAEADPVDSCHGSGAAVFSEESLPGEGEVLQC